MAQRKHKKKTIGSSNPIADYLRGPSKKQEQPAYEAAQAASKVVVEQLKKQRVTIHMAIDLIERVKNAVYWEPGLTLTDFAQAAFERHLKKMESSRGDLYPQRKQQLKGGRPMS